jgi:hypothetical protein
MLVPLNAHHLTDTMMGNGGSYSKGILSRHTLPSHTSTEANIDWSCFNDGSTCSRRNQEDEGQICGHLFIMQIRKTAQEGIKFIVGKR